MGWSSFYPVPLVFPELWGIKINHFLTAVSWFLSTLETSQLSFVHCAAVGLRSPLLTPLLHPEKQSFAARLCLQGATFHKVCVGGVLSPDSQVGCLLEGLDELECHFLVPQLAEGPPLPPG